MKAQAKKMNVDSLKNNQKDGEDSAEVKIAKVAITNVMLWACTWTPYAIVAAIGVFGNQMLITPIVAQLPSFLGKIVLLVAPPNPSCSAKTSSCLNPIVFAVSHPKFREAMAREIPCLGIGKHIMVHSLSCCCRRTSQSSSSRRRWHGEDGDLLGLGLAINTILQY